MKVLSKLAVILLVPTTIGFAGWDMSGGSRWNMITAQRKEQPEPARAPLITTPPVPDVMPDHSLPELPKYSEVASRAQAPSQAQPTQYQQQYQQTQGRFLFGRVLGRFRGR